MELTEADGRRLWILSTRLIRPMMAQTATEGALHVLGVRKGMAYDDCMADVRQLRQKPMKAEMTPLNFPDNRHRKAGRRDCVTGALFSAFRMDACRTAGGSVVRSDWAPTPHVQGVAE